MRDLAKNRVVLGDAVKIAKTIADNSLSCIIADPPYNIGKNFGNNLANKEIQEYLDWCEKWISECLRALAPNGTMFIYGFSEILALILAKVPLDVNRRWLVWHYTNKNMARLKFWQRSHESILVLWKEDYVFNKDLVREPYTENFLKNSAGKTRASTPSRFGSGKDTTYNAHEKGALPRDVIKISALAGGAGSRERVYYCKSCDALIEGTKAKKMCQERNCELIVHPTQKPLELSTRLLNSCKQQDNLVFIPFAGTGSECLAAKHLQLDFIATELNPDYVKLVNLRLAK